MSSRPCHATVLRNGSEKIELFFSESLRVAPRRVMLPWQALFVRRICRRALVVKPLAGVFFVEAAQIPGDSLPSLAYRLVGAPVNSFLLEATPKALHVHIVYPTALAVQRDTYAVRPLIHLI